MPTLRPLRMKPLRKLTPLGRRGSPAKPLIAEGKSPARKGTGRNPSSWPVVAPNPQLAEARKKGRVSSGSIADKSAKARQKLLAKYTKIKPPPSKAKPKKGLARGLRKKAIGRKGKVTGGSAGNIRHIPVTSSNVESYGYDPKEMILEIRFHSGYLYRYWDVPMTEWSSFQRAPSKGKHVWRSIRSFGSDDKYVYERVE